MVKVNIRTNNNLINKGFGIYKEAKEAYDEVDKYIDISTDKMVSGLEPIGDTGLYKDPSEPADPRDCGR